jgi:hypothetical protein
LRCSRTRLPLLLLRCDEPHGEEGCTLFFWFPFKYFEVGWE